MSNYHTSYISIQGKQTGHERGKMVPVINQKQRTIGIFGCGDKSKTWTDYIKKTLINFIWMYVVGIIAFYITILSVSAHGSFLRENLTTSMLLIFSISLICSSLFSMVIILWPNTCKKIIPSLDDEVKDFITNKSDQDDKEVNEPLIINQGNIRHSFTSIQIPSFHEIAAIR